MKPTTSIITLPPLSDSSSLAKYHKPGEPTVVVKMTGVGNNQPYSYRAGDKTFMFRWVSAYQGHVLRVPLNLWQQNKAKLAHEIMDQRKQNHALVVLLEVSASAEIKLCEVTEPVGLRPGSLTFSTPEMGAADTTPAQNVAGLSEEPTAAPAVEDEEGDATEAADLAAEMTQDVDDIPEPSLGQRIYDAVYERPKRLNELAASLGVMGDSLRNAIARHESRVEIAAAGWVRRKEEVKP